MASEHRNRPSVTAPTSTLAPYLGCRCCAAHSPSSILGTPSRGGPPPREAPILGCSKVGSRSLVLPSLLILFFFKEGAQKLPKNASPVIRHFLAICGAWAAILHHATLLASTKRTNCSPNRLSDAMFTASTHPHRPSITTPCVSSKRNAYFRSS